MVCCWSALQACCCCATGYDHRIPFIDEQLFNWQNGRPQLYMTVFHAQHPTLFVLGLLEVGDPVRYAALAAAG